MISSQPIVSQLTALGVDIRKWVQSTREEEISKRKRTACSAAGRAGFRSAVAHARRPSSLSYGGCKFSNIHSINSLYISSRLFGLCSLWCRGRRLRIVEYNLVFVIICSRYRLTRIKAISIDEMMNSLPAGKSGLFYRQLDNVFNFKIDTIRNLPSCFRVRPVKFNNWDMSDDVQFQSSKIYPNAPIWFLSYT